MRSELKKFVTLASVSVLEALKEIDQNQKGFLVVLNHEGAAVGTLTDGDIRRAFIAGKSIDDSIDRIYKSSFTF